MLYKIINGSVTLGNKTILEEINFEVKNNEHVAIVGKNGCGKSTLLKAIIGDIELDKGLGEEDLGVIKLGISKLGYIRQDAIMDNSITMLDEILKAYDDILVVEKKLGIAPSIFVLCANIFLLCISFIFLGKDKTIHSAVGALLFPLFIELTSYITKYIQICLLCNLNAIQSILPIPNIQKTE